MSKQRVVHSDPKNLILACGACAAENIVKSVYNVDIHKAINPLSPKGFLVLVARLSAALQLATNETETKALQRSLNALDIDWVNVSDAERERAQRAAHKALGLAVPGNVKRTGTILRATDTVLLPNVKTSTIKKFNIKGIASSLTERDKRTSKSLTTNTSFFVRDGYDNIHDKFSEKARGIVDDSLKKGLSSFEISVKLEKALPSASRKSGYWDMIAMTFSNRSRTYAMLNSFEEAGIESYRFEAVLDEATSKICQFMHGTVFSVPRNTRRIEQVVADDDPTIVKDLQPWMSQGRDEKGQQILYFNKGGARTKVAEIRGDGFSNALSPAALDAVGVNMPPLHGHCRSTIIPA